MPYIMLFLIIIFGGFIYAVKKLIPGGKTSLGKFREDGLKKPQKTNNFPEIYSVNERTELLDKQLKELDKLQEKFEHMADEKAAGMLSMETAESDQGRLSLNYRKKNGN